MSPILAFFLLQGLDGTPSAPPMLTQDMHNWLIVSGAIVVVTIIIGLWFMLSRPENRPMRRHHRDSHEPEKKTDTKDGHRHRRRRRHRQGHSDDHLPRNPTLAETGGSRRSGTGRAARASAPDAMQESRAITRKSASNLALAFVLLPKAKRDAMSALYAFCREVDDVADEESVPVAQRREQLSLWRDDVRRACDGNGAPRMPVNIELQPVIRQYRLPFELFDELIKGVEMDLDIKRYENYEQLELYCYRVASVVGLLSIEIFGYQDAACRDYAVYLGKALQLTNILRDVRTDAERGRIYLPQSELARFNVTEREIFEHEYSPRFRELAASVAERAKHFYQLARETLPVAERRSMVAAELMGTVYWRLLRKLEARRFDVLGPEPTRLTSAQKLLLILRTWLRFSAGTMTPCYGTN